MGSSKHVHRIGKVNSEKRGITPKQAMSILREQGVTVDEKQAEKILEMMYFFAKLVVGQQLNK